MGQITIGEPRTPAARTATQAESDGPVESTLEAQLPSALKIPDDEFQRVTGLRILRTGDVDGWFGPSDKLFKDEGGRLVEGPTWAEGLGLYLDNLRRSLDSARKAVAVAAVATPPAPPAKKPTDEQRSAWMKEFKAGCKVARRHHKEAFRDNFFSGGLDPDKTSYREAVSSYKSSFNAIANHLRPFNPTSAALLVALADQASNGPTARAQSKLFKSFLGKARHEILNG